MTDDALALLRESSPLITTTAGRLPARSAAGSTEDVEFSDDRPLPPAGEHRGKRRVVLVDPDSVEVRDLEWIERGYLPKGELTILQGHGGVNKGSHCCYWASMVTNGHAEDREPGVVLFVGAEDSLATTLKPRLIAAGADMSRIRFLAFSDGGYTDALRIPDDVQALHETVEAIGAKLVVIDPILTHLSAGVDSYRDHDVKRALQPLKAMAEATGCAVLAVHHLNKDTTRGALRSGQASGAFINTARVVLAIVQDDEDEDLRVLEVVKANGSRIGIRQALRIETVAVDGLADPVVRTVPAGFAAKSVDELLKAGTSQRGGKKTAAKDVILRALVEGRQPLDALKALVLAETGASGETTWRAASDLKAEGKVTSRNDGVGVPGSKWYWELAESTSSTVPANPVAMPTSSYTTNDDLGQLRNEVGDRKKYFVNSASMTNLEVRRLLKTYRPELIGADDITTAFERRQIALLLLVEERMNRPRLAA